MKISVIAPVRNEFPWIGYSIMAARPFVHEFIYAVDPTSDDGTIELLRHIAKEYGNDGPKIYLLLDRRYSFDPMDMKAYNKSFNDCIDQSRGDACWFLHPDMIVTKGAELKSGPLAWTTKITSYAGDLTTQITMGRASQWKNIHAKKFGLHYFGGYGSVNEDFYHSDITGNAYRHFGSEFLRYPFEVAQSGISVNHYCEVKSYARRLEKMKLCLKTQNPLFDDFHIEELAINHPRVTLKETNKQFGVFEFEETKEAVPEVFLKYKDEFESFRKEAAHV